ncbi:MAG: N-acetylmuramoyl-L-alanine amidase [Synechococcaceae cyanobacterium]|nr:N-acetylmuramoyl-L-alanine amidase [Synechococcaceae cyanobacterium]
MPRSKIYLHWSATPYGWVQPGHYHSIITGDGVLHRLHDYNIDLPAHTYRRNANSVGLACACMGGTDPWSTPPTQKQLQEMCAEVARLIRQWDWKESDISVVNIMTHAEAAANRDGWVAHENYGPQAWGGTGERWDLMCLEKGGPEDGGDRLRAMIRSAFLAGQSPAAAVHPLAGSTARTMEILDQTIEVLVDSSGSSWARVSTLLGAYGIPYIWDAEERRILVGACDVAPRHSRNRITAAPGLPTFELALQGGQSAVILVGVMHQNQAYCRVLEFAEEFGISASFQPFALHERRGG